MATEMVGDFNETCEQKIRENPENAEPCPGAHCNEFQESVEYHESCYNRAVYSPVQTVGCYNTVTKQWVWGPQKRIRQICNEKKKEDPNWDLEPCTCCCSCFANMTPIGLPDEQQRPIGEISVGDTVLAGRPSTDKVEWEPATVGFSQGTEDGHQPAMVYIVFGEGAELITTPDQPLMLDDGTLTTASRLIPGQKLMDVDGNSVPVRLVSLGGYEGGVHHISTNTDWTGSIDDHLLQANGVVVGDFTLQLHFPQLSEDEKAPDWKSLPEVGTAEYQQTHSHLLQLGDSEVFAAQADEDPGIENEAFTAYGAESPLPLGTQSFVTLAQAEDILENGQQAPITEQSGYSLAEEAIALVGGFYPGFVYYIDWNRNEPNVYAFEQYGQKVILVSGGLARMKGIGFTALTMAVAHGVGRFVGNEPKAGKYSCTGPADLFGFGVVSRKVWFGKPWMSQTLSAMDQLTELFKLISPENAKGNPQNVCEEPSIQCREETWSSALGGGGLPECAGGPPVPPLTVEQATVTEKGEVRIVFSQAPEESAAQNTANYELSPAAKITKATVDPKRNFVVTLAVEGLEPGKYELTCAHLESIYGGVLKPDPASVEFEVAPEGD